MSITQDELASQFGRFNPEAGSFEEGFVDYKKIEQFNHITTGKILELSRKPRLTDHEARFIQHAGDMSSRSIQYLIDNMGMKLPDNRSTRKHLDELLENTGKMEDGNYYLPDTPEVLESPARFIEVLAAIPARLFAIPMIQDPENVQLRRALEDYAVASLDLFTDLADHIGGLKIDRYLQGNIQNIIAHYELIYT